MHRIPRMKVSAQNQTEKKGEEKAKRGGGEKNVYL